MKRFALLTVVSAILVALPTHVAGAPDHSVSPRQVGIGSHLFWFSEADASREMARIRAGGVRWIREDLRWDQLEPERGRFDWTRSDALMTAASKNRMNVLGILDYSSTWASSDPSGRGDKHFPPDSFADYANFAAAVVSRYGPEGDFWVRRPALAERPLRVVELWNEPWGHWFWKSGPDPKAFARMVKSAVGAIRSKQPKVKILLPGDLELLRADGSKAPWLTALLEAEPRLPQLVDGYSVHPYPAPRDASPYDNHSPLASSYGRVELIHRVLQRHDAVLPLWITEVGWSTASELKDSVTEEEQASFLRGAVVRATGEWGGFVKKIFVFSWDRSTGSMSDLHSNYGMRREDDSLKPAWEAVTSLLARSDP